MRHSERTFDVVAGFALPPTEVAPTLRLLRESGWTVSAVHNHFLNVSPHLFFLHAAG